jgi:hypothetical protein
VFSPDTSIRPGCRGLRPCVALVAVAAVGTGGLAVAGDPDVADAAVTPRCYSYKQPLYMKNDLGMNLGKVEIYKQWCRNSKNRFVRGKDERYCESYVNSGAQPIIDDKIRNDGVATVRLNKTSRLSVCKVEFNWSVPAKGVRLQKCTMTTRVKYYTSGRVVRLKPGGNCPNRSYEAD